jgi:uncharacterized membrane protein YdcZ (DUF606 family)
MQTATVVLTLFLGVVAVLQGTLNRLVAKSWGLTSTILFNNMVILVAASAFYLAVKTVPRAFPESFAGRAEFASFSWYYVLPGLFGFTLVAGIPLAIGAIGALDAFVIMVCAQMATSLVWDGVAEGIPPSWPRVAGAALAVAGVLVSRIRH